jgi:hypothetical protein
VSIGSNSAGDCRLDGSVEGLFLNQVQLESARQKMGRRSRLARRERLAPAEAG